MIVRALRQAKAGVPPVGKYHAAWARPVAYAIFREPIRVLERNIVLRHFGLERGGREDCRSARGVSAKTVMTAMGRQRIVGSPLGRAATAPANSFPANMFIIYQRYFKLAQCLTRRLRSDRKKHSFVRMRSLAPSIHPQLAAIPGSSCLPNTIPSYVLPLRSSL